MKKYILIIFIFILIFTSQAKADVYYECDSKRDYILIAESDWSKDFATFTKKEVISKADIIKYKSEGKTAFRTTKPIFKHCQLSSGEYLVTFDAHWLNNDVYGLDGGDDWLTIEIHRNKEIILPLTVLGYCDNERPATQDCKSNWAVKVWFSGRYKHAKVTRIVDENSP